MTAFTPLSPEVIRMDGQSTYLSRRQFLSALAAAGVGSVAGCGHPPVVLDMEEATSSDIADEASTTPEPDSEEHALVTSAIEKGSATRSGRYELFDRTGVVRVDGSVYEVSETRVEESELTEYELYVDVDTSDVTPELGAIAFEDLPAADQRRLEPVLDGSTRTPGDGYEFAVSYGSAAEVGNDSVLVPERQYDVLVHGEDRYRLALDSSTAPEATYRYEVTEIAPDVESFADQLREQYLFALTDLSEAERAVVEEALDGTYYENDDAYRSVVDRIRSHEGLTVTDSYGTWLLAYEGVEYLTYADW